MPFDYDKVYMILRTRYLLKPEDYDINTVFPTKYLQDLSLVEAEYTGINLLATLTDETTGFSSMQV